jgi:cellulose synthase/poly-beta-1,6-N-acetylglucosamine synthase-like glycosyltransferase
MLEKILLVTAIAYATEMIIFAIAILNARYSTNRLPRPTVSIIIAARNEERYIRPCLESLLKLKYPSDMFEIIIVDDRSTDSTRSIIQEYAKRYDHIKLLIAREPTSHLRGKTNAIAQAIDVAVGDILFFTDADCTVQPDWVKETVKYYEDHDVGIVAGFTALSTRTGFETVQAIDWFFLYSAAAAMISLNFPATAAGNNFSVRREAYNNTGGYRTLPFSITEDYALFHAITTKTHFKARLPLDAATVVNSEACKSWNELYNQKRRWFIGLFEMELRKLTVFAIAFFPTLLIPVCLFSDGIEHVWLPVVLKIVADLSLALPTIINFNRKTLLRHFIQFEVFYSLYMLLIPLSLLLTKKVQWKDQIFSK